MGWARSPQDLRGRDGLLLWASRILLLSQVASITAARHSAALDVEQSSRQPVGSSARDANETLSGDLHGAALQIGERLAKEIEYELEPNVVPEKNKLVLAVMELVLLGICGVDRCYMGQVCLGVLKGMTLGGVFVWFIIDWIAILISNLAGSTTVEVVGYRAVFSGGVDAAFWLTLALFILTFSILVLKIVFNNVRSDNLEEPEEDLCMFDKDGSGYVTKEALKRVLLQNDIIISDEEVKDLFRELDTQNSGRISVQDLQKALRKT